MMYVVLKCQYCQKTLTHNDIVVTCTFCRHNPCYFNGQEESMVMFDHIPIDGVIYSAIYHFKTREIEILFLQTIDPEGYIKQKTLTKLIAPIAITPDNVEDFMRRCVKMKVFA